MILLANLMCFKWANLGLTALSTTEGSELYLVSLASQIWVEKSMVISGFHSSRGRRNCW